MTAMQLKKDYAGRDFLSLLDYTTEDLQYFLEVADYLKAEHKAGRPTPYLQGKTMGLIFEKSSTRTRVSFEAAFIIWAARGFSSPAMTCKLAAANRLRTPRGCFPAF